MTLAEIRLVSVNVAEPQFLAMRSGAPVVSAIAKQPVADPTIFLDQRNLTGDRQADRRFHGGPDKAVYAYPADHFPAWQAELGIELGPGSFGENLTTAGWHETDVCIGDVWEWGEARLQVTQPRSPCYKLALHTGRPDLLKRFVATGRTGWYLRVLRPGNAPVAGPIRLADRDPAGISVLDAHRAGLPNGAAPAEIERLLELAPLAAEWKRLLRRRLKPRKRRS